MDNNEDLVNKKNAEVNSLAFELLLAMKEANKRMYVIVCFIIISWLLSIGGFVWYLNQYDFTSTTTTETFTQDSEGYNIIGDNNQLKE